MSFSRNYWKDLQWYLSQLAGGNLIARIYVQWYQSAPLVLLQDKHYVCLDAEVAYGTVTSNPRNSPHYEYWFNFAVNL